MVRVTEILDTFPEKELVEWQLRVGKVKAQQVSESAKRIGTIVDQSIQLNMGRSVEGLIEVQGKAEQEAFESCMVGYHKFLNDPKYQWFKPSIVSMQSELYREGITGHPDFELIRNDLYGVIDVKCAGQIRPTHWVQTAGYWWLKSLTLQQMEIGFGFLGILRLDKELNTFEYQELDVKQAYYELGIWNCYRELYEHRVKVAQRYRIEREDQAYDAVLS